MRDRLAVLFAVLALGTTGAGAQKLYKHVGPDGSVVYTDRPATANQKEEKKRPANVSSPEATRQIYLERRDRQIEYQEEAAAQRRRHQAQRQREAQMEREQRAREAAENPGAVQQAPYRPRVRPTPTPR